MEKRTLKRIPVSLEANILLNKSNYAAHIINISAQGLHMIVSPGETTIELTPGTEYKLAVTVPSGDVFRLLCRVRWSSGFLHYRLTKIVGLMIIDPPPEYRKFYRTTLYEVRNDISHSPIAVIGMAGYYPGAPDLKRFWENILARRREFRQIPEQRLPLSEYYDPDPSAPDKTYGNRAAVIDGFEFDWIKRGIPKTVVESTDIAHWLALEVALKALADAGYTNKNVPPDRSGVVLGNTMTGEHSRSENMRLRWPYVRKTLKAAAVQKGMSSKQLAELTETMEEYYKSVFSPITEDTLAGNLSNTIAGRICNFLNLNGGGYTVDGACSSSLIAVATAATALSNGKLDIALTGGVDISLDTFELVGFAKTNALTRDDMRVYDRQANGFIPGEGSGFVVLKRLEDARADGDRIYAVLRGWGISSDGKGGLTAPKAENQALAIRRAYTQAGYALQDIDFIEGHGTGTPAGDKAELEGIAQAMNDGGNDTLRSCGITSLKSIIGHTKAASGIGGFIKAVIAVNRRVLPPTAGCTEPNPVFHKTAHAVYPILQGALRSPDDTIRAGVSGMGFGGINCHVTLESGDAPAKNLEPAISEKTLLVSHQNTELFALSAESQPRLLERIQQLTSVAQGISIGDMVDLASHLTMGLSDQAPWRAALVAATPQELTDSLKQLEKMLIEETPPHGKLSCNKQKTIWLGNSVKQARIGFLFPGQGSQQLNMTRTLVERFSWAQDLVDQADSWLTDGGFEKISPHIYRPLDRALNQDQKAEWAALLTRTEAAQPAICLASLLWVRYLDLLGIEPVAAGGHSLGELTAFYMAGALSEKDLLRFASFRGKVMAADTKNAGVMAGFACNRERAEDILQQIDGYAVVANINSPTQTVISGEKSAVKNAMQLAATMDIMCKRLPVANGFHSQFVIGAADLLRREAELPGILEHINIKLLSCMEGAEITPGVDLRNHFAQQMVSKGDFISLVNKMAQECDLMVEVGPGRVLTSLTSSCLDNGEICFPVEAQANDDHSLNTFLGCYFVRGGTINWSQLYENRLVRPFIPPGERLFIDNPCERPLAVRPVETRHFPTNQDEPVVSLLAAAADVPAATISNYIHRRSRFLGNLIKADLDDSSSQQAQDTLSLPEVSYQEQYPDFVTEQKKAETTSKQTGEDIAVSGLLLELIEKRTGFPQESLSLELRLLDDLNLDSIKAAELIAETAKHLNLTGEVDPSQYANTTIQEVADAFEQMIAEQTETADQPKKTKDATDRPSWVRNFVIAYAEEQLPQKATAEGSIDLKAEKVLLLSEAGEQPFVDSLRNLCIEQGAQVQAALFTGADQIDFSSEKHTCCIGILPRMQDPERNLAQRLDGIVDRLRIIATAGRRDAPAKDRLKTAFIQFGGGSFGAGPETSDVEQCSTLALASSLHYEQSNSKVRVIDFAPVVDPLQLAKKVHKELSTANRFAAVGYDQELTRRVPKMLVQEPASYSTRPVSWSAEDVILVTGGAKGITAECALELAGTTHATMALIGSSPQADDSPSTRHDNEISRTLKRFHDAGLKARYYQCDVVDAVAVDCVVAEIRQDLGDITGVIHGSALNLPRDLQTVSTDEALREVSPKVTGAVNLCRALADSPPKLFIGFSSIIGVSGMMRNGWYGFSNEALNLILQKFGEDHPETAVLSIGFSIWDEVGMGVRMGSTDFLARMGVGAIPPKEGVRRFLQLFMNDPGEQQVIVAARLAALDSIQPKPFALPANSRFLENIIQYYPGVEVVARTGLSLEKDPYIKDHLWRGTYLFPTVFGLEAMAQAVGYVTGETDFTNLLIENIKLERPIPVSPDKEAEIEIRAEVLEKEAGQATRKVRVGIATRQTGFHRGHFSATFVLGDTRKTPQENIELPASPLDIKPEADLYNTWLLFQGPQFQRIDTIYSLNSKKCIFRTATGLFSRDSQGKTGQHGGASYLIGDPFLRDSLLHSAQLTVAPDICLPLRIEKIERFHSKTPLPEALVGVATVDDRIDRDYHSTVFIVNEKGQLLERISGYTLRILEHHENYPTAEEIADPNIRDEAVIRRRINEFAETMELEAPEITAANLSGFHQLSKQERHAREIPYLQETIARVHENTEDSKQEYKIAWRESGKPYIEGLKGNEEINISLSHNRDTLISVAGLRAQGCDIESLSPRTPQDWLSLLGPGKEQLLQQLINNGDTMDQAGTRIWTAVEALRKALDSSDFILHFERKTDDGILFKSAFQDMNLSILTFPIQLARGPERIIALTAQTREAQELSPADSKKGSLAERLNFDRDSYKFDIVDGPKGQPVFIFQFPVTFKEASNPSRTIYFSQYFTWLGKLREFVIQPIYEKLVESFSTGKWGMVTNHAETQILGTARSGDIIEGHVWFDKVSSTADSTIEMCFEWWKRLPQEGGREKIAVSEMSTTWVAIRGHGIVEVQPMPEFGKEFLRTVLPPKDYQVKTARPEPPEPALSDTFGDILYQEPAGPVRDSALLKECIFETTLEDSNLVGNIYFSNYYLWQGRVRDRFVNEIVPEYFNASGKQGEFRCANCRVDHMSEAMPFERIAIRMYRSVVYEKGLLFYFDYFRILADGGRQKLGYGMHEAIWNTPTSDLKNWAPSMLPKAILAVVIPKDKQEILDVTPRTRTKIDNKYDVIVVGAGIGGLTAASLLTKHGVKVAVVEQHNKPGGFCTSWARQVNFKDRTFRYVFDAGVHDVFGLGPKGHVRKLLKDLDIEERTNWRRVDHQYIFPDLQIKVPRGIDEYIELLCNTFPKEREGITAFFQEIRLCFAELYGQTSAKTRISRWIDIPFHQMVETFICDQRLKELLSILHLYVTNDITKVKSSTMIPVFGYYYEGGYYPVGGSQAFSNLLASVIQENGGNIFLGNEVSRIVIEKNNITGIILADGRKLHSEIVISNADLRRTFFDLIDHRHLPTHYFDRIKNLKSSNSAFLVSVGVDFIPDVASLTVVIEEEEHVGILIPSKIDPSLAPKGHASITLLRQIPYEQAITWKRNETGYTTRKKKFGNKLIRLAEKAIPDLSKHIIYRQEASPATFARYAWTTDGTIFGTSIDAWKPSTKTPVQGLYLTGASISARPGLDDAVNAGMLASNAILRQKKHTFFPR
jgi:enediyne polyketide synthase